MKTRKSICTIASLTCAATLACSTPVAFAQDQDAWEFSAVIYGWFPDITGNTRFPNGPGGGDFEIGIGDILDNLEFTLMGTFDARKNRWGMVTDVIYMDVSNSVTGYREGTIGGMEIPVDANATVDLGMKSWIWSAAGYYRAIDEADSSFDVLFGFRYLDIEQELNWTFDGTIGGMPLPGRTGGGKVGTSNWDAIVGLRGRVGLGDEGRWYLPYYGDIGAGDSDLTWQAAAGIGYAFGWGEVTALWRHLDYDLDAGKPIADMEFSGPAISATFRW